MSKEQKIGQREDLYQQIQKLRDEAGKADAQIKKNIERRNELNEQVKKAREEIAGLRAERDSQNEKVKLLKSQRDEIRKQSDPITEEINKIKEKISKLRKTLPRESQQDLQEQHDAIEWKISTTSLDLKEEKQLIEEVKQLEILLRGYKKIEAQNSKIKELIDERKTFDDKADILHKELTDLASKSQAIHANLMEKVNAMRLTKAQADAQHQAYVSTKEEVLPAIYVKIAELTGQLKGIKASIAEEAKEQAKQRKKAREVSEEENKQKQQALAEKQQAMKEKLGAEAKNKLQKGEKLSWDEFQLMMGDESEEDSETQG